MRRFAAIGVAVGLVMAGVGVVSPAASARPDTLTAKAPGIDWGPCSSHTLQAFGAVCGYLSVPLDYAHPKGAKIKLAVSMIRHTVPAAKYQGVMLTNPGGPGGSGLGLSILGQFVPKKAGAYYDWIGFDPRGVGASIPALSCDPNYFAGPRPDYNPTTRKLEQTWLARSKAYAQACGKKGGALLNHLTTIDSARDMDSIRVALGQRQINYYGFSYGTYLGQVYTTLFPSHMRRMVLDSNVDPRKVWYQANLDQDIAFEGNMKIWFGWVAKYDSVYHLGTTAAAVQKVWYAQKTALRAKPAGGVVGSDEWTDIFLSAGYYQSTWLDLGKLFANWVHNADVKALVAAYQGAEGVGDDNNFAMYAAVQCSDVQWPTSWSTWRRDNWRVFLRAPFETWGNAWFNAPCLYWPARAHKPVKVNGEHVAPALLIDETLDAATPYPGSLEVRKLYPKSRLIAEPGGTTHAGTLNGNACVDNQIADYLANGTLPARKRGNGPDAVCAPLPQPDPTAPAPAANGTGSGASRATASLAPSSGSTGAVTAPATVPDRALLDEILRQLRP